MERISKAKISRFSTLKTRKGRRKERLFMVQGGKAVRDVLSIFTAECLILKDGVGIGALEAEGVEAYVATEPEMKKVSTLTDIPDVIAIFKIPEKSGDLMACKESYTLVLDGVSDPGNFGTIIRTAHWFGIERIFCSYECPDLYNPKVVQSTMGSMAKVEVVYCDLRELFMNNPGVPVYGLLLNGRDIFREPEFKPGFMVMGNEGHGISEEVVPYISDPLTIPPADPRNHPDSLNVAIATAITLGVIKH